MRQEIATIESNYDVVGMYEQDRINGFSNDLIGQMLGMAKLENAHSVLDAMAGDGNLSERMLQYCKMKGFRIEKNALLEYSQIQSEFAREKLERYGTQIIWGDIIECCDRRNQQKLPKGQYDRVLIKSASHEIPFFKQQQFADSLHYLLKENGLLVNLGFLLLDRTEREEFAKFTKIKDSLAGMEMLVENRHFLLKEEYYDCLEKAGFEVIEAKSITYTIDSRIVAQQYFPEDRQEECHLEFQLAQLAATTMRKNGTIEFDRTGSVMHIPGEITVARRLPTKTHSKKIYQSYPYSLVQSMRCHKELRSAVAESVPNNSIVLDLGCGPGFLSQELAQKEISYTGVDLSSDFVTYARSQGPKDHLFLQGDLNSTLPFKKQFDVVMLINVLYQSSINVTKVLSNCSQYTRPGGFIVVAGPLQAESFKNIEHKIKEDLLADGVSFSEAEFEQIVRANDKLLSNQGSYWSAEGMVQLLAQFGYTEPVTVSTDHYYGNSYLVVARRPLEN